MPIIKQKLDEKSYSKCNMDYLRRYLGLRELIITVALIAIGILMYVLYHLIFVLVLAAIVIGVFLIAFLLFVATGKSGYKHDFVKNGITEQSFEFKENELIVSNIDMYGHCVFKETHPYEKLDRVSIKQDRVYIYAQVAVFYYITTESLKDVDLSAFADFLHTHIPSDKFKIKKYSLWHKPIKKQAQDQAKKIADDEKKKR